MRHFVDYLDRAGLVGPDGATHNGVFDIAYLRSLPNIVVAAPRDESQLVHMLHTAIAHDGPFAVRYPRGEGTGVPLPESASRIPIEAGGRVAARPSARARQGGGLARRP